jgi:hypothetical protein
MGSDDIFSENRGDKTVWSSYLVHSVYVVTGSRLLKKYFARFVVGCSTNL